MPQGKPTTLAFDVYGTLVDPSGMAEHLQADIHDNAMAFVAAWRDKQLEYAFRRGLMQCYASFAVCTADAFDHTAARFAIAFSSARRGELLAAFKRLPAFAEAMPALQRLRAAGHRLFAFSNGTAADVSAVLGFAGLHPLLQGIISVDELRTFRPAPAVYAHLRRATGAWSTPCWVVSSHPWDIIGARAAGLDAAWVRRSPTHVYDPWGIEPTLTITSLAALAARL